MDYTQAIGLIIKGFEVLGVAVLIVGSLLAVVSYAMSLSGQRGSSQARQKAYQALRQDLGRAMLLGLEFLVIADIVHSIAIDPTLLNIGSLGLLVFVRTFLSWSLEVEIEGAWPWQRARSRAASAAPKDGGEP